MANTYTSETVPSQYARAFKPADIRGIYPTEINEAVAYRVGRGFVELSQYKKIVVGYDMRLSTPALRTAFIAGARDGGAAVIDVGMCRSPFLYFASGHLQLPGAMITASHSPAAYNGIKLVKPEAIPLTAETGLAAIQSYVHEFEYVKPRRRGRYTKRGLHREYKHYVLKNVDRKASKGISVVADIGNGMAGHSMKYIDAAIAAKFHLLFPKPDGSFPNRDSDPCLSKNQTALKAEIVTRHADFGIGFDGDGDRIAFLDEKGRYVNCAAIGALIADRLLQEEPKGGIVFTNLTSRVLEETVRAKKGKAIRAKVGHTFLKEQLRKHNAIFGAEHSGHFFWRDFFYTDSTMLTLLKVLEIFAEEKRAGQTFSQMMKPYLRYQQTEDVVVEVTDKQRALQLMGEQLLKMKPTTLKKFDGYYVDFGDVWGAVKPSVTEYAIKLMFESTTKAKAQAVQKTVLAHLRRIAKNK